METEDGRIEIFRRVAREALRSPWTIVGPALVVEATPPRSGFDISVV
jgi:hypothetical protein